MLGARDVSVSCAGRSYSWDNRTAVRVLQVEWTSISSLIASLNRARNPLFLFNKPTHREEAALKLVSPFLLVHDSLAHVYKISWLCVDIQNLGLVRNQSVFHIRFHCDPDSGWEQPSTCCTGKVTSVFTCGQMLNSLDAGVSFGMLICAISRNNENVATVTKVRVTCLLVCISPKNKVQPLEGNCLWREFSSRISWLHNASKRIALKAPRETKFLVFNSSPTYWSGMEVCTSGYVGYHCVHRSAYLKQEPDKPNWAWLSSSNLCNKAPWSTISFKMFWTDKERMSVLIANENWQGHGETVPIVSWNLKHHLQKAWGILQDKHALNKKVQLLSAPNSASIYITF